MTDQTQPGGGSGAGFDPWAPPESKPSLEKSPQQPAPGQQPPGAPAQDQPPGHAGQPSVHDQSGQAGRPPVQDQPPAFGQPPVQDQPPAHAGRLPVHDQPGHAGRPPVQDQPPAPGQQPPMQPPSAHDQDTMAITRIPAGGFAAPGFGPPGAVPAPAPGGWDGSAVPPPPIAPTGPWAQSPAMPPGGYGAPGYPQGYGWRGMPMAPQNGMGTAAMVLGILSCCLFCVYGLVSLVLGVIAVVLGIKGKKRADRGEATNRGQAQAGLITGIVGIVLGIATIAVLIFAITTAINDEKHRRESDRYYNSAPGISAPVLARESSHA